MPARPPVMCAGLSAPRAFSTHWPRTSALSLGDIGCYTLGAVAPLGAMDMTHVHGRFDFGASTASTRRCGEECEKQDGCGHR